MRSIGILVLAPFAVVAIAACTWGVYEWANPPFTDDELRNFVDTWEPSAWVTMISLVVLAATALIVLPVAVIVKVRAVRSVAVGTVLLACLGAGLIYRNHAALTHRVTELTGQTFGGLNGLGIF